MLRKREKKEREREEYRKVLDDQVQQVTARRYQEAVPNMEERRYVEERRGEKRREEKRHSVCNEEAVCGVVCVRGGGAAY